MQVNPLLIIMSENVLQLPHSIVVVDGETISGEHLQRALREARHPAKCVDKSCCRKSNVKTVERESAYLFGDEE